MKRVNYSLSDDYYYVTPVSSTFICWGECIFTLSCQFAKHKTSSDGSSLCYFYNSTNQTTTLGDNEETAIITGFNYHTQ